MDSKTIFSKTAKGLREASGGSSDLPRAIRGILKEIDGKSGLTDLVGRLRKVSEADLVEALTELIEEGYVRETNPVAQSIIEAAPTTAPASTSAEEGVADLDFTSLAAAPTPLSVPSKAAEEAQRKAQADKLAAEAKARQEAENKAKIEAQLKAKIEAEEKIRREAAAKIKAEAEEKARQLAMAKTKAEAEEKAKQAALAKAKLEAETKARLEAEARLKKETEEKLRRDAEEQAKQAALAKARLETEEKNRRDAEEQARREAEAQARKAAEERSRREAAEKVQREAEEQARIETERKAREEAEARTKREAAEKAQREAAERARLEAEETARAEAELRARQEEEARLKREVEKKEKQEAEALANRVTEEKIQREAELKARQAAEEQARRDAETRARKEAEEKARREAQRVREEAEALARQEAEKQAQIEAKQAARREDEARRKRDAEEKERLAAWEMAKRKAEEKLKQEAEEKARREAEDRLKIETRERAEREEEARLKEALKEKARQEAEEKALRDKQERIRKEAEEELRQEEKEKARREAEAEAEAARIAAEKIAEKRDRAANKAQVKWGKLIMLVSIPLVAIAIGAIHIISFNGRIPDLEKLAAEQFQQPVKIESLHLSLFPPHWRLDGVTVGSEAQIKAPQVNAAVDLGDLFGASKAFKSVEFKSPVLKEAAVGWLLFGRSQGGTIRIGQLRATDAMLESPGINLPHFDARADLASDGKWQKVVLEFSNKDVYVELHPEGDHVVFDMNATTFLPPFGGTLQFDDFTAKGSASRNAINVSEFVGRSLGGSFSGNVDLKLDGGWSLQGKVVAKQVDTKQLAASLLAGGRVDGKAAFAMQSSEGRNLFVSPHLEGNFVVGQGEVIGIDVMHMLTNSADSGKTGFRELAGSFVRDGDVTQLRQVRLDAGILSVVGSAELDGSGAVRGRFTSAYKFDNQRTTGNVTLSGTLQAPKFGL